MSIDIPNGFTLKRFKTLDAIYAILPIVRDAIIAEAERVTFQTVIDTATHLYDFDTVFPRKLHKAKYSSIKQAKDVLARRLTASAKEQATTPLDLGFSVGVGMGDGRPVGLYQTTSRNLKEAFFRVPDIAPYDYTNLSDRPRNVTEKQWAKRHKDWSSFEDGRPLLLWNIIPAYHMAIPSSPLPYNVIPFPARLHKLADEITIKECKLEFGLNSFDEAVKFVTGNSEYSKRLAVHKERLAEILDKDITLEKLEEGR